MNNVKLRAHHLSIIYDWKKKNMANVARLGFSLFTDYLYNSQFRKNYIRLMDNVTENTLVEIVSDNDDICALPCPFANYCADKNYSVVTGNMVKRLFFAPKSIKEAFAVLTPEIGDKCAEIEFNVQPGKIYTFKDIKISKAFDIGKIIRESYELKLK